MGSASASKLSPLSNLIITFILISFVMLANQTFGSIKSINYTFEQTHKQSAQIATIRLASSLAAPTSGNKLDEVQRLLEGTVRENPDMSYAVVVSADGHAISSTDPAMKGAILNRNQFEKDALVVQSVSVLNTPKAGIFEVAAPIDKNADQTAILRVGFSSEVTDLAIKNSTISILVGALLTLVIGASVYTMMVMRILESSAAASKE